MIILMINPNYYIIFSSALLGVNISAAFLFTHLVVVLVGIWSSRDKTSLEPVLAVSMPSILTDSLMSTLFFFVLSLFLS